MVQGIVYFQRIPNYQIFCTYLPTTCILFMAVLTMFIDESHFEATIMVALTAMLVLYTLFQSISEVMPTTSYLKLIGKNTSIHTSCPNITPSLHLNKGCTHMF